MEPTRRARGSFEAVGVVMEMHRPSGDIDYIIMTSANEDDRLIELLVCFRGEYPDVPESEARDRLKTRLEQLVLDGKVGIYADDLTRHHMTVGEGRRLTPEEDAEWRRSEMAAYRDLSTEDSLQMIRSEEGWAPEVQSDAKAMYYLCAKDPNYFGHYYGNNESKNR